MARRNLAYNPSFRLGIDGYTAVGGASLSVRSSGGFYGNESLLVTKAAVNGSGVQGGYMPVSAGEDYAYSAYVSVPITVPSSDTANLVLMVSWYTAVGTLLETSTSEVIAAAPRQGWLRLTGVDTAPVGAAQARLSVTQLTAGRAKQPFLLDALLFEESSYVGGYLDNVSEAQHQHAQQRGLSPYPQDTIGGVQLNADITLGNLVFNTIDENGVLWVISDLAGWWGQAEPDITDIKRGVEDGSYDTTGRYNARTIVMTGSFLLPDPSLLNKARDLLVSATNLVRKGAWLRTNEEPTRAAFVKLTGKPNIETVNARGRTDFSFTLRAADPIRYEWNDEDPNGLSSDILAVDPITTNRAINPSFERLASSTVVAANYVQNPTGDGAVTSFVDSTVAIDTQTGSRAYKFTTDTAAADTSALVAAQRPVAASGQTWWGRARLHLDPVDLGARQVQLITRFRDSSGNVVTGLPLGGNTPSGVFHRWTGASGASTSEEYTTTGKRVNLLTNPGAESNSTTPWTPNGNATVSVASNLAHSGSRSLKITGVAGQNIGLSSVILGLTPGQTYTYSAYVYIPSTNGLIAPAFAANGAPFTGGTELKNSPRDQWVRGSVTFIARSDSAENYLFIYDGASASDANNARTIYVDDAMLELGSTMGTYFDGDTANTYTPGTADLQIVPTGTLYRWQGTPNNSPSERWTDVNKYINVIPNPAAEGSAVSLSGSGADVAIAQSAVFSSNAYRASVQAGRGKNSAGTVYQQDGITPGQPWSGRARAHLTSGIVGPRRLQSEIAWLDSSSALISTSQGGPVDIAPTGVSHLWTGQPYQSSAQEWNGTTGRVNLLGNGGFESGTIAGFSVNAYAGAQGTLAPTTERAYGGQYSAKYTAAGGGNDEGVLFHIPAVQDPTQTLAVTLWVYVPSGGFPNIVLTAFEDAGGRQLEIRTSTTFDAWERLDLYIPANWTGGDAVLYYPNAQTAAGSTFYMDNVMFGDYDQFFDGNTVTPVAGTYHSWVGTAFASPSVEVATDRTYRTNWATYPLPPTTYDNLGSGKTGWTSRWFGNGSTGTETQVTNATDGPPGIKTYQRKQWTTVAAVQDIGWGHTGGTTTEGLRVSPGETITISTWIRGSRSQPELTRNVNLITGDIYDKNGTKIQAGLKDPGRAIIVANQWVRYSATFTVPANGAYVSDLFTQIYLDINSWAPGDTLDGTGLLIERSDTVNTYFDGSIVDPALVLPAPASTQVVDLTVQGIAPANAVRALWRVNRTTDLGYSDSDVFYVDQAMLSQMLSTADQSYFDGNTPSTGNGYNSSVFDLTAGVKAPQNATSAELVVVRNGVYQAAIGDVIWFDNAMLTQQNTTTAPAYFDGTTVDDSGYFYGWASTPFGSTSQRTLPLLSGGITGSDALVLQSVAWYSRGNYAMEVRPTASTPGVSYADITSLVSNGLEAGKQYTVSVRVHRETASLYSGALSYTGLLNQTPLSTTTTLIPATAGTWLLSLTFTAPDISNAHQLRFYNNDVDGGSSLWFDELIIVEGSTPQNYFDGDTPDEENVIYYWTGTANNSASVRAPGSVVTRPVVNIGTADVTGTFEIEGPLGPGSTITNAANGQVITTVDELRGIGGTAAITSTELNNEIATITTSRPHGLEVGDVVVVSGAGTPYDSTSANPTYTVTAVTNLIPYTFNYAIPGYPDLDAATSSGQVGLANNDVLTIDTYDHSVIFNDTVDGNRSRIATLVDWMQFAPGENLLTLSDNAARKTVTAKKANAGRITITTDEPHFFIPGEDVVVNLAVNADIATKSLTNNVVTITTVGNHGFSIGDKITVTSTESSAISTKTIASGTATIGTSAAAGFSVGDLITVSMPTTASISSKASSGNTATLTTAKAHGFSVGDNVTTAFLTTASITAKSLLSGTATLTTSAAHGFSIGDTVSVALPTSASVTAKYRSGNNVVLTTSAAHGFSVGDRMTVTFPVAATLASSRQMMGTNTYYALLSTTTAHGFAVGDRVVLNTGLQASWTTTTRQSSTSTMTIGTNGTHNVVVGETIVVSGMGKSQYNGTFTVLSVTSTSIVYSDGNTYTTESLTSDTGGAVVDDTIASGYNGTHIIEAIPTSTTFNILYYGQTTTSSNTTAPSSAGSVTNTTNTAINGTYPIASVPSATQFSYQVV